ncbi:PAS domain-containing protein [Paenibacillus chibensis]|uniref:PAS domain-containing protein n=1 Tax=Paenibacillus chibensis TaxID=59846 RepID=UPI0027D7EA9F|nr:PAS domain-containing protein [Paenibacillus chibensis]
MTKMDERLKYAPCGYVSITHEGIVTDVNQTFLDLMGYVAEELLHKHLESIMSTANKLIFHSYFYPQINLNGRVEELFISLKDKQKQTVPFILNGRRFEDDGVEVIDCVLVQMKNALITNRNSAPRRSKLKMRIVRRSRHWRSWSKSTRKLSGNNPSSWR